MSGWTGGGREEGGYRTKNKNPTRQCGEQYTTVHDTTQQLQLHYITQRYATLQLQLQLKQHDVNFASQYVC